LPYRARAERIPDDGFEGMLGQAGYDPTQDWASDPAALADAEQPQPAAGNASSPELRTASRPGSFRLAATALAGALVLGLAAVAYGFFSGGEQNGAPIVVRADNAPVKVKPENPGGAEIANQDQAAYDKVAGAQPGGTQQEQLVTASEKPVEIAPAEVASAEIAPSEGAKVAEEPVAAAPGTADPAAAQPGTAQAAAAPATDGKAEERLAPGNVETTAAIPTLAPRRVKTLTIKPDGTVVPPAETAAAPATQETAFAAPGENATLPGVEIGTPLAQEGSASGDAGGKQKVSPIETASVTPDAAVANGEWAVQLASQRSAEDAQATFKNLKQKFPGVLDGKPMSVQRAEVSGKGVFYRVRVPTQTKDEAVALCDELKAAGGSCFITR
jgi:cell division septation protein DedD